MPTWPVGGFSGRESDVSVSWLAQEVRDGNPLVLVEQAEPPVAVRAA